jgi:hypothetical protein
MIKQAPLVHFIKPLNSVLALPSPTSEGRHHRAAAAAGAEGRGRPRRRGARAPPEQRGSGRRRRPGHRLGPHEPPHLPGLLPRRRNRAAVYC